MRFQVRRILNNRRGWRVFKLAVCLGARYGVIFLFGMGVPWMAHAAAVTTIGGMADLIIESFESIARLITASSYVAGLGFTIGAILKFKQHKDSPTQVPVGTPIAMLFVASALLFFPSVLKITGNSIFGTTTTAGPTGLVF